MKQATMTAITLAWIGIGITGCRQEGNATEMLDEFDVGDFGDNDADLLHQDVAVDDDLIVEELQDGRDDVLPAPATRFVQSGWLNPEMPPTYTACVLTDVGAVWCWGASSYATLGALDAPLISEDRKSVV